MFKKENKFVGERPGSWLILMHVGENEFDIEG